MSVMLYKVVRQCLTSKRLFIIGLKKVCVSERRGFQGQKINKDPEAKQCVGHSRAKKEVSVAGMYGVVEGGKQIKLQDTVSIWLCSKCDRELQQDFEW